MQTGPFQSLNLIGPNLVMKMILRNLTLTWMKNYNLMKR